MNTIINPVLFIECIMLFMLIIVGFYVSYTDIVARRVPNRYTFFLLTIGLLGQSSMVFMGIISIHRMLITILVGFFIAYGLTLFGLWAPGDGKLYWASGVSLPPTLFSESNWISLQIAPVSLLLHTLLCYLVAILFLFFWRQRWKIKNLKYSLDIRKLIKIGIGLAGLLGWILIFVLLILGRPISYLVVQEDVNMAKPA